MEREFDIRDMAGTPSTEWRHLSGVCTHRSVKWCPDPLNHQFLTSDSHSTAGMSPLTKESKHINDKKK